MRFTCTFFLSVSLISLTVAFPRPTDGDNEVNDLSDLNLDLSPGGDGNAPPAPLGSTDQGNNALAFADPGSNTFDSSRLASSQSTGSNGVVAPAELKDEIAQEWNPVAPLLTPHNSCAPHNCERVMKFVLRKLGDRAPAQARDERRPCKGRLQQAANAVLQTHQNPSAYRECTELADKLTWWIIYDTCYFQGNFHWSCWWLSTTITGCFADKTSPPGFKRCVPPGQWPPNGIGS